MDVCRTDRRNAQRKHSRISRRVCWDNKSGFYQLSRQPVRFLLRVRSPPLFPTTKCIVVGWESHSQMVLDFLFSIGFFRQRFSLSITVY